MCNRCYVSVYYHLEEESQPGVPSVDNGLALPIESLPTEALPIESLRTEVLPTESLTTESLKKESLTTELLTNKALPTNATPTADYGKRIYFSKDSVKKDWLKYACV